MARHAFPVSLYLNGRKAVVVGAGEDAEARAARLEAAGAEVTRLPAASAEDVAAAAAGAFLVVATSDEAAADRAAARASRAAGALAYAHDQPHESDFAMPAIARRGPIQIAISTDGVAPALSRRLREIVEAALDAAGASLDELVAELAARRSALAPGRRGGLYAIARKLSLAGGFVVDDQVGH